MLKFLRALRDVPQIGAKCELEATAKSDATHRGDDGYRQLAPEPDDVLGPISDPVRGLGEIGKWQDAAAGGHGNDSLDIETGAKGTAFT